MFSVSFQTCGKSNKSSVLPGRINAKTCLTIIVTIQLLTCWTFTSQSDEFSSPHPQNAKHVTPEQWTRQTLSRRKRHRDFYCHCVRVNTPTLAFSARCINRRRAAFGAADNRVVTAWQIKSVEVPTKVRQRFPEFYVNVLFYLFIGGVFLGTELWINANMAFHELALCIVISPDLLVSTFVLCFHMRAV